MRLKSFSTYGFKSFADKTELTFDKGITAVVGPNGSGKSNISDAIRWVLGEQSAKYLRGSKMEDVIFSGSGKRRALGVAEVTVDFDNSDRTLPLDFEQVSLTRRIFRSGESEYAINKKSCRLKDIIDLMADTGLGKGSMSIIGQNKIDEVLNSRPEDRRSLFEEAAGIAKYRLRKKDAVRKLDDTANNLTRINDIRSEVDAQVEPLAQAAAKTQQFNELSEELRRCRLSVLLRRLDALEKTGRELQTKKEAAAGAYSEQAAKVGSMQAEAVNVQQELDKLAEAYNKLQDDIKTRETALEKLRGDQKVLDERVSQNEKAGERLVQRNERLEQQVREQEARMQELAAEFDAVEKRHAVADGAVKQLQAQRDEQSAKLEEAKRNDEQAQSQFFSGMQELINLRNELHNLEQEQEQRARRREALKKSIEEAEEADRQVQEQYNSLLEQQSQCAHGMELVRKKGEELRSAYDAGQKELQAVRSSQQQCQRQLTAAETREQSLKRLQQSYEGFSYGIKAVLKAQEPWREQVVGVAAELLQVEDKYVAAIETALGEGAQNLVMRSANAAKEAIAFLKRTGSGRATFLPLDTVQPGVFRGRLSGTARLASALVQADPRYENIVSNLLGRIIVVEDINEASRVARDNGYHNKVVTMDGQVINAGGSFTGGSVQRSAGLFTRKQEMEELRLKAAKLQKDCLAAQEKTDQCKEQADALQAELTATASEQITAANDRVRAEAEQKRLEAAAAQLETAVQNAQQQMDALQAALNDSRAKADAADLQQAELTAQIEQLTAELSRIAEGSDSFLTQQNQLAQALSAKRLEQVTRRKDAELAYSQIAALEQRAKDAAARRTALEESLAALAARSEACRTEIAAIRKAKTDSQTTITQKEQAIREATEKRLACQQKETEALAKARTASDSREEMGREMARLAERKAAAETEYDQTVAKLWDEYQLSVSQAEQLCVEFDSLPTLRAQVADLRGKIRALGSVNVSAIEEYKEVKARYDDLSRQVTDVEESRNELSRMIAKLSAQMREIFTDSFRAINENFSRVFTELFGGGEASLVLEDESDVLACGIGIRVAPPGKVIKNLEALSGGEQALVAISIYFAILAVNPAPFCILDEIEAALDDANVVRFAQYLRRISDKTQFIVITHRRGTMEAANVLYGVTMQEDGVSKLLKLDLEQVDATLVS